jgi:4-oxalomesaconate hydratase
MNSSTQLLVISAHAADFVWRAGGAIATVTQSGGTAKVIALSYGERGESGELWKEAGQTEEKVKAIRRAEGEEAATILGASFEGMDLGSITRLN